MDLGQTWASLGERSAAPPDEPTKGNFSRVSNLRLNLLPTEELHQHLSQQCDSQFDNTNPLLDGGRSSIGRASAPSIISSTSKRRPSPLEDVQESALASFASQCRRHLDYHPRLQSDWTASRHICRDEWWESPNIQRQDPQTGENDQQIRRRRHGKIWCVEKRWSNLACRRGQWNCTGV